MQEQDVEQLEGEVARLREELAKETEKNKGLLGKVKTLVEILKGNI